MKFLADESCAGPVIYALRKAGHDVLAVSDIAAGAADEEVLDRALRENRVLITEDRDFGNLVYGRAHPSAGVVLVRFHTSARGAKPAAVVAAVAQLGSRLRNAFAVVEPGRVRLNSRP